MLSTLPKRALFQFEFPVHRLDRPPLVDADLRKWTEHYLAPPLVELEGGEPFADVYWGWHEDGFFAAFDVPGRTSRPQSDPKHWWKKNGMRLCIDTRAARGVKRATRFCHFFYLLPTGGGPDGKLPVVGTHRMSRSKEPPPAIDVRQIKIAAHVTRTGYSLEVGIPSGCLHGWAPAEHPRVGLFYKIKDSQLGSQHLSTTDDLGWNVDPSTWATGVLIS